MDLDLKGVSSNNMVDTLFSYRSFTPAIAAVKILGYTLYMNMQEFTEDYE